MKGKSDAYTQEKMTGQRGKLRAFAGYVMSTKVIFSPAEVLLFWQKSVFRDVRIQSCIALRFLVTPRPPLHEIFVVV